MGKFVDYWIKCQNKTTFNKHKDPILKLCLISEKKKSVVDRKWINKC